jgi:hypothetical protein
VPYKCVAVQLRVSEPFVSTDIRDSRPARCDPVHVSVTPGSLKLVKMHGWSKRANAHLHSLRSSSPTVRPLQSICVVES